MKSLDIISSGQNLKLNTAKIYTFFVILKIANSLNNLINKCSAINFNELNDLKTILINKVK